MDTTEKLAPWRQGITAVAREIGRSPSHVWRVVKGERPGSPQLRAILLKRGFKLPEA